MANFGAAFALSIRVTSKDETVAAAPNRPTKDAATLTGSMAISCQRYNSRGQKFLHFGDEVWIEAGDLKNEN